MNANRFDPRRVAVVTLADSACVIAPPVAAYLYGLVAREMREDKKRGCPWGMNDERRVVLRALERVSASHRARVSVDGNRVAVDAEAGGESSHDVRHLLDANEVSDELGVTAHRVRQLHHDRSGVLPAVSVAPYRFTRDAVDALKAARGKA